MTITPRDFIKANAIAATAAAAGVTLPSISDAAVAPADAIRWDKAPCRFCGTGCSVLVGTRDGRVVATQGDPDAPVNRGLNCIKGYFLSKIMYDQDRLTTPLLRKKNGKYDKNGEFTPVSLGRGARPHGAEIRRRHQGQRPVSSVACCCWVAILDQVDRVRMDFISEISWRPTIGDPSFM